MATHRDLAQIVYTNTLGRERTAAKAEQKKADTAAKAEASANKPKPRPRTLDDARPKGRGFVLS